MALQGSHGDVYLGGSLGVESVQQKDEQAFAARVNTAKSVYLMLHFFKVTML